MQAGFAWNYILFHHPTLAAHCIHVHLQFITMLNSFYQLKNKIKSQLFWYQLLMLMLTWLFNFIHIWVFINVVYVYFIK